MASTLFQKAVPTFTLEEMQRIFRRATNMLNERRVERNGRPLKRANPFATVRTGEVLIHPATRAESFLIQYSEKDRAARWLITRIELAIIEEGRARLERVDQRLFRRRQR